MCFWYKSIGSLRLIYRNLMIIFLHISVLGLWQLASCVETGVLYGRPSGGVAILVT